MNKKRIEECEINSKDFGQIVALAVFGSYHEDYFILGKSDIDIMVLTKESLNYEEEFELEDALNSILIEYFQYDNLHYTFLNGFTYPFSEILVLSEDQHILQEEEWMEYLLGFSCFKRDREYLEIMREANLKEWEELKSGLL